VKTIKSIGEFAKSFSEYVFPSMPGSEKSMAFEPMASGGGPSSENAIEEMKSERKIKLFEVILELLAASC
jgi:hypothetical protein